MFIRLLGGSAEIWLQLQESFDLWKAGQALDTVELQPIDFNQVACYEFMQKATWP